MIWEQTPQIFNRIILMDHTTFVSLARSWKNNRKDTYKKLSLKHSVPIHNSHTRPSLTQYSSFYPSSVMMNARYLLIATIGLLLSLSDAKYVSIGMQRESLADDEFSFSFKEDGITANITGIKVYALTPPRHRLLGMPDVDVSIVRVVQQPGFVIPWHVHPRGSENYATISGTIQISLTLELVTTLTSRKVVSKLPGGHASSIPQGLPHSVKCISDVPCEYHIFFNTADAGFALTAI